MMTLPPARSAANFDDDRAPIFGKAIFFAGVITLPYEPISRARSAKPGNSNEVDERLPDQERGQPGWRKTAT
jgi:hypothetical protein